MAEEAYKTAMAEFRTKRAQAIATDRSWLTLAGLYWLQPGENRFGVAPNNAIVLPDHAGMATLGSFTLDDGQVTLHFASAQAAEAVQVNGQAVDCSAVEQPRYLQDDMTAAPDWVVVGALSMIVIKRGGRCGIRLFDNTSPRRKAFTDLRWYPIDPANRIVAQFVPYEPAKAISYGNVLGDVVEEHSPGAVLFTWNGVPCRLDAQPRGDKLFFNFRDETNGDTTYGAGRFLTADGPADGTVILDFNQATNPYCAYTDYATCPLPPAQNRLAVRIEAGEQRFVL